MGMSRALPSGVSPSRPSARGPLLIFACLATCPTVASVVARSRAAKMTKHRLVGYKLDREGEVLMDINDKAPEFTLPDQNGKDVSLKDFRGKTVILFFYPKADTPG